MYDDDGFFFVNSYLKCIFISSDVRQNATNASGIGAKQLIKTSWVVKTKLMTSIALLRDDIRLSLLKKRALMKKKNQRPFCFQTESVRDRTFLHRAVHGVNENLLASAQITL